MRRYEPNGVHEQCQCVRDHEYPNKDKSIEQCCAFRWEESNRFCEGCQRLHGEASDMKQKKA